MTMGPDAPISKDLPTTGHGFEQSISRLILSIIPATEIYYWYLGVDSDKAETFPTVSIALQSGPPPWSVPENCQKFIGDRQQDFQGGKILVTDFNWDWRSLTVDNVASSHNLGSVNGSLPYLLLPVFKQDQYVGGICLGLPNGQWNLDQYFFLQEVGKVFAYQHRNTTKVWSSRENCDSDQRHSPMVMNLSHIHHEFRTPLSAIIGFARMLEDELYGNLNPKQHQYVGGILNSADHLLSLVNDFLDLSKIEANCEELFCELVAVEDLCLSVISMVHTKAKEKQLDLNLEIADGVDFCYVDQKRWKQILINLLSNGIKFTPQGSVTLTVEAKEKALIFSVIDTGIGISPTDQKNLFQPFKQFYHPPGFAEKGTGLGLALSRRLAQLHGGDIELTSTPGIGSRFSAILPLKKSRKSDSI